MQKTYEIDITEETANLLERLAFEIQAKEGVVTRIITTAVTPEVFNGVPYQTFMKQLEEAHVAYETAKKVLETSLKETVAKQGEALLGWKIDDFKSKKAIVTVTTDLASEGCTCGSGCCKE